MGFEDKESMCGKNLSLTKSNLFTYKSTRSFYPYFTMVHVSVAAVFWKEFEFKAILNCISIVMHYPRSHTD